MLKETIDRGFQVGDTVIITATKQSGKIVAFEGGRWKVKTEGGEILKEANEIQHRTMLFG